MYEEMKIDSNILRRAAELIQYYCLTQNQLLDTYAAQMQSLSAEWEDDVTFSLLMAEIQMLTNGSKEIFDEMYKTYPLYFLQKAEQIDARPSYPGGHYAAGAAGVAAGYASGVSFGSFSDAGTTQMNTRKIVVSPFEDSAAYPSDSFGTQVQLVKDRLSDERYFFSGEHFEEYRKFWESGDFSYEEIENPEIVYIRARNIEGVYLWDTEKQNPEGFWTRHGKEGWSRENIVRRASRIQDVKLNLEHGIMLEELEKNPDLQETIYSYFQKPVEVASLDSFYVFQSDGRHRILAAQTLDTCIPVLVTKKYKAHEKH